MQSQGLGLHSLQIQFKTNEQECLKTSQEPKKWHVSVDQNMEGHFTLTLYRILGDHSENKLAGEQLSIQAQYRRQQEEQNQEEVDHVWAALPRNWLELFSHWAFH